MEMLDLPPTGQSEAIEDFITLTKGEGNPLQLGLMRLQLQFTLAKVEREEMKFRMRRYVYRVAETFEGENFRVFSRFQNHP